MNSDFCIIKEKLDTYFNWFINFNILLGFKLINLYAWIFLINQKLLCLIKKSDVFSNLDEILLCPRFYFISEYLLFHKNFFQIFDSVLFWFNAQYYPWILNTQNKSCHFNGYIWLITIFLLPLFFHSWMYDGPQRLHIFFLSNFRYFEPKVQERKNKNIHKYQ